LDKRSKEDVMNTLVIALDAAGPLELDGEEILVVAPALNSRLRHWLSDDDGARHAATERLDACLERLEQSGVHAHGRVGDADPVQAIADSLPGFAADEVVIAAPPIRRARATSLFESPSGRARGSRFRFTAQKGRSSVRRPR
jgi:hypothetical protein